ncbi:hypothetical protein LEP1GSC202_0326 [Leptospira yanagawae serovar Saopaulo str. Sao Paulo = ATCC 700523]|uniref:Uncharacterized protein n=1 Tax=Leptospira yanagawae serovar Saopaulo str. Sao Paulo = ATCC 700523 TaxID=1249483 RepID=A0A5E8HCE5_9LEPT|nr:hypothetical protein [Leptospira yanagawae]EOQ88542.1 hypothetical protein LEP1GSC202_0326 [Leptospira yanagawae serovar Saopaulo str. Sao Paulo = ATCC 700523]
MLNKNPSTNYKWSISDFDELGILINSIRSERNNLINKFLRPKVIVLFPEDIFESERVFLRTLFEEFAKEIYNIEFFHICQLSIFSIENLVGKRILSMGDRINQTFTLIENSKTYDSKIFNINDIKIQEMDFDLIISHKSEENSKMKSNFFLKSEELRYHLISGSKIYIDYINSI